MRFEIKGTPHHCSKEFVRAWLQASVVVLNYHKKFGEDYTTLDVEIIPPWETRDFEHGTWTEDTRTIQLRDDLAAEDMATTVLHEVIHALCGDFGDDTDEKCTSTLTAKLKPDVAAIAQVLLDGTYRRAAYIAHTKLSYRTDLDHYDRAQDRPVGTSDKYSKENAA